MGRSAFTFGLAVGALMASGFVQAHARGGWGVGFSFGAPAPIYAAPPVYYAPPPVFYAPPPPVYYAPPPPPVYYAPPPPVVYAPPPAPVSPGLSVGLTVPLH